MSHTFTTVHKITMIMCNNNTQFSKCMTCFPMTSCRRNLQQRSVNGQDATRKLSQRAEWGIKGRRLSQTLPQPRARTHTHTCVIQRVLWQHISHTPSSYSIKVSESPWSVTCTPLAASSNSYNAQRPRPNIYARANIAF